MLKEFTAIISDDGTSIRSVDSKPTPDGGAVVDFVIETVDVRHLNKLVLNLRKVPGVGMCTGCRRSRVPPSPVLKC